MSPFKQMIYWTTKGLKKGATMDDAKEGMRVESEMPFTLKGFLTFLFVIWSIFGSVILMVMIWKVIF